MVNYMIKRFNLYVIFLVTFVFLLIGCAITTGQNDPTVASETLATQTATILPSLTTGPVISSPTLPLTKTSEPDEISLVITTTVTPIVTATSSPIPTYTPTPSPTVAAFPCNDTGKFPGKAFPSQVDMSRSNNQRVAISYPFLYLAVEQYIGVFDISDPDAPQFWGFWDFPEWPDISTLQVHNGVAYFTSGSTLIIVNLSLQCRFQTISTIEIPAQVFQIEIEGNRLYVDETSIETGKNLVAVFSISEPSQPLELGIVDLGQIATWSVFDKTIYSLGDELITFDVSDPANPSPKPANLTLDPDILAYSPSVFQKDRLYLLWETSKLTIISQMHDESPVFKRNPQQQIVMGDLAYFIFQVSENYIFLGGYSCDIACGSYVTFFDIEDGQKMSGLGIPDHQSPVYSYYEIKPDVIYAFTDDSLLIIDISSIAQPVIIAEVSLIT